MTTETRSPRQAGGVRVLVGAALVALSVGLALAGIGAMVSGNPAAYGALAGTVLTTLVLFGGSLVVDLVAGVLPAASLLVALLTYTLQLVLLGVAFLALQRSEALRDLVDRAWVGFGVIAVTVAWMVAQILLTTRRRIPAFEGREGGL